MRCEPRLRTEAIDRFGVVNDGSAVGSGHEEAGGAVTEELRAVRRVVHCAAVDLFHTGQSLVEHGWTLVVDQSDLHEHVTYVPQDLIDSLDTPDEAPALRRAIMRRRSAGVPA